METGQYILTVKDDSIELQKKLSEIGRIVLTVKDVAKLLYCSEDSARTLMKNNVIKCMLWNGKEYRTTQKYVDAFLDEMISGELNREQMYKCTNIVMNNEADIKSSKFLEQATKKLRRKNVHR